MNAIRAEWTKLRTTPGPAWLLLATAVLTVALGVAVSAVATGPVDTTRLALSGVYLGQAPVAMLAVLSVSGEYSTSLIRTTLTAVPVRATVLAAKAVVLAAAVTAAALPAVIATLLLTNPRDPVLRAGVGTIAYLVLIAMLSLGAAAIIRDSGAAIGTVLGLLYLPPLVTTMVSDPDLHRLLEQLAPMTAGLTIQATRDLQQLPTAPWTGLGVLAAWSVASLLLGALLFRRRDA